MAAQQGQGSSESSTNTLWLLAMGFCIILFIWYKYHGIIVYSYLLLKKFQLLILMNLSWILPESIDEDVLSMLEFVIANPDTEDFGIISYISHQTGKYLAVLQAALVAVSFRFVWRKNAQLQYNKKYSMMDLARQEQENWPKIMPITGLNLIDIDVNEGPWAMALSPLQFAKKHDLIKVETVLDRKSPWKTEGVKKMNLQKDRSHQVFLKQMGALWEGEYELPDHRRALFAIFLARIEHDHTGASDLIKTLAISYSKGRPDFSLVNPLIQKHKNSKKGAECVQSHAFVMTVLSTMLKVARTDGVLASSDFIWLKPMDRELWYMLNTMGRQTPFCEVAGPYAHWKAEMELGRPLFRPIIAEATRALEESLDKILYTE